MTRAGRTAAAAALGLVGVACGRTPRSAESDTAGATASAANPSSLTPGESTSVADTSRSSASRPAGETSAVAPPAPRPHPTPTPSPAPTENVLTGKVVAGGLAATPSTSLQVEGGKPMVLAGPLEPELRRLGGATVWVTGGPVAAPPNAFSVSRYEIVSIDGAKPVVGSLASRAGATWIVTDRDTLKLTAPPAELTSKPGAKVWIVGRRSANELAVQTFGVIREP